jgi:type I restriction enzyme M protein
MATKKMATKKITLKKFTASKQPDMPKYIPQTPSNPEDPLKPLIEGNYIWCPLKAEWRVLIPEERIRQGFILILNRKYGYEFGQMDQERRTKHGHKSPKVDIAIWTSIASKNEKQAPIIVVECKSDNVTIDPDDYEQGDSYARAIGDPCEFLVMHNHKESRFFKIVRGLPGAREDIENIPNLADLSDSKRMEEIRKATKAFSREEFRRLLFECHCILRDNHKMEPGTAFDEISKILFIKMYIERTGNFDKFTTTYLNDYARLRRKNLDEVMNDLFDDTKNFYHADELFDKNDKLTISFATFKRIVQKLERFNLGATSDDIKGIAFERFLGQTFRGDLGQFFTPRPIVNFMVEFCNPDDSQVMCDPASGSGGFLIKFFEYIRNKIELEIHEEKKVLRHQIESQSIPEEEKARLINESFTELNKQLDVSIEGSRLWNIAHQSIFGCDAEPRAARTSKMNMIMHGDGHGGIHHHDGLVDFNGIFPDRFDIILTNPPFGATVGDDQIIGATPETRVSTDAELNNFY